VTYLGIGKQGPPPHTHFAASESVVEADDIIVFQFFRHTCWQHQALAFKRLNMGKQKRDEIQQCFPKLDGRTQNTQG